MTLKHLVHGRAFPAREIVKRLLETEAAGDLGVEVRERLRVRGGLMTDKEGDAYWAVNYEGRLRLAKVAEIQEASAEVRLFDLQEEAFACPGVAAGQHHIYNVGNLSRRPVLLPFNSFIFKCVNMDDWVMPTSFRRQRRNNGEHFP